jgi:two-component system, chemotaxis family, chemotaxis protein CheY
MPDGRHSSTDETPLALIVDDSERILADARRLLEPMGFRVLTANDGEAGMSLAVRHHPALILLDWALPGMSGIDFLRTLRAVPGYESTQVIVCSGHGRPADIHLAMRAGASEYLLKPFDPELLAFKLRQIGVTA